jgi:hypothetical protein
VLSIAAYKYTIHYSGEIERILHEPKKMRF